MGGTNLTRGGQTQQQFEQGIAPSSNFRNTAQSLGHSLPGNTQGYGAGSFSAPLPGLTAPVTALLQQFLQNPQQALSQFLPTSDLQRQASDTFSQLLRGQPQMQTDLAQGNIQDQLAGVPGGQVVAAAQPLFQQNLTDALSRQREFGGQRFASESGRQASQLEQRSLQDFNLFAQQALMQGRQQALQEALGAGGFAQGQQGQQLQLIMSLLGPAFQGGGVNASPLIEQKQGFMGGLGSLLGSLGSAFVGAGGIPGIGDLLGLGGKKPGHGGHGHP